jgi:hypothetical protein
MILKEKTSFSKGECDYIINLSNSLDKINPFGKSDHMSKNKTFKVKYDVWPINRNEKTQWIFDKIQTYFINKTNIKIKKELDKIYIHKYIEGQQFGKHADTYYKTQIHNVGVCLNNDYDGGEFVLYNPEEQLPKESGVIYTFPSVRLHEVKEILKGERWSIIGFLHTDNLDLPKKSLI